MTTDISATAWIVGRARPALARFASRLLLASAVGVAALVGLDWAGGTIDPLSVVELLVVAVCYACEAQQRGVDRRARRRVGP